MLRKSAQRKGKIIHKSTNKRSPHRPLVGDRGIASRGGKLQSLTSKLCKMLKVLKRKLDLVWYTYSFPRFQSCHKHFSSPWIVHQIKGLMMGLGKRGSWHPGKNRGMSNLFLCACLGTQTPSFMLKVFLRKSWKGRILDLDPTQLAAKVSVGKSIKSIWCPHFEALVLNMDISIHAKFNWSKLWSYPQRSYDGNGEKRRSRGSKLYWKQR